MLSASLCLLAPPARSAPPAAPRGFEVLFDGKGLDAFKVSEEAAKHWVVKDGVLQHDGWAGAAKGEKHLWTQRSFKDFVLRLDWRLPQPGPRRKVDVILPSGEVAKDPNGAKQEVEIQYGGDSGIYLRGSDKSQVNIWNWPIGSGEVYGYRTDASQPPEVRAGVTPKVRADKPLGEWNTFVILMKGERLSVDLNGVNVISNARLPGIKPEGPIALQHHGDPVDFRNLSIRELPEGLVDLLDSGLEGWKAVGAADGTWTLRDGLLRTSGKPAGYIRTLKSFESFALEGEWRFPSQPGSTGLLLHTLEPDKVWPTSIEIQLDHKHFGNFIKIGDVAFEGGRRTKDVERPAGQWNHFEAVCRGAVIECHMNGEKVSEARGCRPTRGAVGFQSEGVEVELRNVWVRPLKD
jgi:hypothetical protein